MNVVPLYEHNHHDTAAFLRKVADNIDSGMFGEVGCAGLVIMGDTTEVFGMGPDSEPPSVAMLLHAGFMRLSGALEAHGK